MLSSLYRYSKLFLFCLGIAGCVWVSADLPGLKELYEADRYHQYSGGKTTGTGLQNVLIQVFKNLAIAVFVIAVIIIFVSTIQLLVSESGEKDFTAWVLTLTWSLVGLLLISIAYTVIKLMETRVLGSPSISGTTAYNIIINIIYPLLNFMRFMAGTVFFIGAIYSFYTIVTSNGQEEGFERGKKIFIGSVVGFVVMMIAEPLVQLAYGNNLCMGRMVFGVPIDCTHRILNAPWVMGTIARIIIFMNSFIALIVMIMIIYAGFLVLTGGGDEEKNDKAKKTITYAIIGILLLIFSFVIYKFMIMNS